MSSSREWSRHASPRGRNAALGSAYLRFASRRLLLDAVSWFAAMAAGALVLGASWPHALVVGGLSALTQAIVGAAIGLYRGRWRLGSFDEVAGLAMVTAAVTIVLGIGLTAARFADLTLVLSPFAPFAALTGMVLARGVRRSHNDRELSPPTQEVVDGSASLADIREMTEADLLGRRAIDADLDAITGYLSKRCVLVTGAGGLIGSELCRQIARFDPEHLILFDRDETALHDVQLSLEGRTVLDDRRVVVGDIRDAKRVDEVFAEHNPDVVFHTAALQHLQLLEVHPEEAWKTNVEGTNNVLRSAARVGVRYFVNVSADKAADPTSVLGYTKRVAERLTAWYGNRARGDWVSVRFGNVLGSGGSVLQTFQSQIDAGGPVTVTHPDVTRYFMTPGEACELVIQAGAVGNRGEALVLDMGQPLRILDMAEWLVAASGEPIEIEFTGLRPGEKLHETLVSTGELDIRRSHPLITHVAVPALNPSTLGLFDRSSNDSARRSLIDLCDRDHQALGLL